MPRARRKTHAQRLQQAGQGDVRWVFSTSPSFDDLAEMYRKLGGATRTWREPLEKKVAPIILRGMRTAFDTQGQSIKQRWGSPSAKYDRRKRREGFGATPMRRTGATRAWLDSSSAVVEVTRNSVSVGWHGPQFKHVPSVHFGGFGQKPHWVAGWSDKMKAEATEALANDLQSRIDAAVSEFNRRRAAP